MGSHGSPHGIPWPPSPKYIPKFDFIGIFCKNTFQNTFFIKIFLNKYIPKCDFYLKL